MNGEIPSVPITTLAGVCSLTDLLTELPLPTPLPHTMNNKSLLYHPKVAEDARRLLASHDDVLVSQLVKSLRHTSSEHIELKDNMANDTIEGEMPELLKAILAKDPSVFKGGALPPPYTEHTAGNRALMGGSQPYPPHPQQPSPYQAGQISPCPPGSPASSVNGFSRLPAHPGSSPYAGQTSAYPPVGGFPPSQASGSATSSFHQQFLNFTASNDGPTVNGGVSGSPGSHGAITPPHGYPPRSTRHSKPATVSSPAQAAAAPPSHDLAGHLGHSRHEGNHNHSEVRSARRKSSSKSTEPVVLLKPLDGAALAMCQPTVKLTRLEMLPGDIRIRPDDRHKMSGSSSRSRYDDRRDDKRGSKRHRSRDDGHDDVSSSDRNKRRRRTANYIDDDSDEDGGYNRNRRDSDDEARSRISAAELNRQRKKKKVPTATLR